MRLLRKVSDALAIWAGGDAAARVDWRRWQREHPLPPADGAADREPRQPGPGGGHRQEADRCPPPRAEPHQPRRGNPPSPSGRR